MVTLQVMTGLFPRAGTARVVGRQPVLLLLRALATVLVLFAVNPGLAQQPRLQVNGAPPDLEQNIRALVQLPGQSCDATPRSLSRFLPDVRQQVNRAGRALGYYFLTEQSRFIAGERCWQLDISMDAGEPVMIAAVNVSVANHRDLFEETLASLPVEAGDQLNHALYERTKSELSSRAVELGFFSARFSRTELRVDLQNNTADVQIEFEPGDRFRFGEVNLEPVDGLSEDFIRRYLNFESGGFYSASSLIDLRNVLNDSFYFSTVNVTPAIDQAVDQQVPVQVGLQLRPRRVYSTGVGVTTDIGPRVRLDYEDRYLNRRGHRFDVQSSASPIQQMIDLDYSIPWNDPATERLIFSGGLLHEDNDTFSVRTTKYGVTYTFMNRWNWRQEYFINVQHDDSTLLDTNTRETSDMLIPGVSLTRTRADDALYPQRGWKLSARLSGASDTLLSTETFLQFYLNGKFINPLGPGRVMVKFEAGTTVTDEIRNLPASIQFFTGGDQSVRGYKYQSLAPVNDSDEQTGGKHLLVAGIEYDFNILPSWKLAVFADAGNAFLSPDEPDLRKSVGIGVRWLSPLGPVRLDLASGLDNDNAFRLHLTMGPDL